MLSIVNDADDSVAQMARLDNEPNLEAIDEKKMRGNSQAGFGNCLSP